MNDQQAIHQLEQQLAELNTDSAKGAYRRIDALNDLAWALADTDMKRAQELAEEVAAIWVERTDEAEYSRLLSPKPSPTLSLSAIPNDPT